MHQIFLSGPLIPKKRAREGLLSPGAENSGFATGSQCVDVCSTSIIVSSSSNTPATDANTSLTLPVSSRLRSSPPSLISWILDSHFVDQYIVDLAAFRSTRRPSHIRVMYTRTRRSKNTAHVDLKKTRRLSVFGAQLIRFVADYFVVQVLQPCSVSVCVSPQY